MDALTATDLRTVGEFRLLARLGSGGMGQVFLASSLAGRIVAVKVIHPELCKDAEFVQRFRNEVEAAQKVSGWYTAPVVAAGVDDNPPWLATAFVSGPSLEDIVTRHGPLPLPAVWRLAAGLAEALRAIHATGLIHRDLKPANVLLALDGPRVIDFGISRAVTDTRLTATGSIIGTPSYMSPEQVEARVAGPASDTFSLGSVLSFAASGSAPFSGGDVVSSASVMYRIVHSEPGVEAVPVDVRGLIEACLAKDPPQRPDLGLVAAHSTAAAERLGLSPAAFWPHDVAKVIQAQQAALAAQVEALQLAPATQVEGSWRGNGMVAAPSGRAAPASSGPSVAGGRHSARSPVTEPRNDPFIAPDTMPVAGGLGGGTGAIGHATPGHAIPGYQGATPGTSRRGLLIGAGVGSIAVIGGAVGWALNSRSASNTPSSPGTGYAPPSAGAGSTSLPAGGQARQKYYGAGTHKAATWKFSTGNAVEANPGAGGGMVYVGSMDNNVYAVDITTRRQAWSYQAGSVTAAPQVVGDVVCLSTSAGHFYALHVASGRRAWDVEQSTPAIYKRTWAVDGDSVILAGEVAPPQAYHAATGAKGLSFRTQEPYVLALSVAGGILYALDGLGILYAFQTATGNELWHKQLLSSDDTPGTGLTIGGGGIYLGTRSGTLYAVDPANGRVLWTYHPGNAIDSDLAFADGVIYLKDRNGTLHAISAANKKPVWTRAGTLSGLYGPTVAAGRVYYTTVLAIQALDAKSGTPVWAFSVPGEVEFLSTPAVANGFVFIGGSDDGLYAIQA